MSAPVWSADFQRLVLAAALKGDLLDKLPLDPALFGSDRERGPQSSAQRIAAALVDYHAKYGTRPSPEVFTQVIADAAASLGPEVRAVLVQEVADVLATSPPDDPRFVLDTVREQLERRAIDRGLVQAAALLAAGATAEQVREAFAKASEPIDAGDGRLRSTAYIADSSARIEAWRRGDAYGEHISTGFPELDFVLGGGPTRREAHYFLAPPKGLKTAALLKVALSASRRRYGVYLATYEMQAMRMALRADRMLSRSSKDEIAGDLARLERALSGLKASGSGEIWIDECLPQRPGSVAAAARRVQEIRRRGGKVDVVVLDYLNIMGASEREQEKRHELPRISRDIASLGKELDVLVWSAALVNRKGVGKKVVRKTDIAEAFEVIAVLDGATAICATDAMVRAGLRRFRQVAAREEADDVNAGDYAVDLARMIIDPAGEGAVDAVLGASGASDDGGGD